MVALFCSSRAERCDLILILIASLSLWRFDVALWASPGRQLLIIVILNTKFTIVNAKFIMLNVKFIIVNAKFII